jgi:hypothetical protein
LLEVVAATVKQHGWEPLSGGDCHDLACASPAAATAGTPYALVLLGSFAAGQDYATDVGASLLRDGKAIARRTEEDEEAEFERSGVGGAFLKCGPPTGFCSAPLITSKLQQYAASLLDAESTAIRTRADAAAAVVTAPPRTVPPTAAAPKAPVAQQGGARSVVGWSLISAGMVLGGAAVGVWAYDNTGTDCHTECRMYQDTTRAALLTGLGALVTAGAGVAVLLLDRGPTRLALSVHPSGLALGGTF